MPPADTTRPLLLGHRGARDYARENTFTAFDLALEHGCDGFEFDVRLTCDEQAIICHDQNFKRMRVAESICEALMLRAGEAGLLKLEQVVERYAQTAFLNIELKAAGGERYLSELLKRFPPQRGCVVSSFLPDSVKAAADAGVPANIGLICNAFDQLKQWPKLPIDAVMLQRGLASRMLIEELYSAGKQVFVWTVNREREMRKFAELGVSGIISDDTRLLAETLGECRAGVGGHAGGTT